MHQILKADILDIVPFEQGFIYIDKEVLENGSIKASFFAYDGETETFSPVSRRFYFETKFGLNYKQIVEHIKDFINCDCVLLSGKRAAVLMHDGTFFVFDSNGNPLKKTKIFYQDVPACSLVIDNKTFWCAVPENNAIVNYSPEEERVLMRVGGGKSKAFVHPVSLTKVMDKLYICNRNSYKIRTLDIENYAVKDYYTFDQPVHKYFKTLDFEYAQLASGVFVL